MHEQLNKLIPLLQNLDLNYVIENILSYFQSLLSLYFKVKYSEFIRYNYSLKKLFPFQKEISKQDEKILMHILKIKKVYIHDRTMVIPLIYAGLGDKPLAFLYFKSSNKISGINKKELDLEIKLCSLIYYNASIYNVAIRDPLTKIYNIRYFNYKLQEYCEKYRSKKNKMSLIMMDIDYFKHYNDKYGHQVGDQILKNLVSAINSVIKKQGIFARYGGEEFIVLLPDHDSIKAKLLGEKIRKQVQKLRISNKDFFWRLTISLGTSTFPDDAQTPERLVYCADISLYHSKTNGKNRTSVYSKDVKKH